MRRKPYNDYIGQKIGIVKIKERIDTDNFLVECDCGVTTKKLMGNLLNSYKKGNIVSCGCMKRINMGRKNIGRPSHRKIHFTEEQIEDIISQHLKNVSLEVVGKQYGCSQPVIRNIVKSRGYTPTCRRSDLNENFFDVIDSEVKAYWLGYLAADGTIRVRECGISKDGKKRNRGNSIHLKLSTMDEAHLIKFRDVVCPNSVLKYSTSVVTTRKGNISTSYNVILNLYSNHIVSQIIDKGVGPRKTFTVGKPNIEEKYIRHYLRGLFDGDGTVRIDGTTKMTYSIASASEKMYEFLYDHLKSLDIDMRRYGINCVIARKEDTMRFHDYIYKDATVWLERKRDKLNDLFDELDRIKKWEEKYKFRYSKNNTWSDDELDCIIGGVKQGLTHEQIRGELKDKYTLKQIGHKVSSLRRHKVFDGI
jgi:hypothetical protein